MRPDSSERYPAPRPNPVRPGRPGAGGTVPAAALSLGGSPASRIVPAAVLPAVDAAALAVAGAVCVAGLAGGRGPGAVPAAAYALAVLAAFSLTGLHRLRITLRSSDQAGRILAALLVPAAVLAMAALIPVRLTGLDPAQLAAGGVARLALVSAGLVLAARLAASAVLRAARRRGALAEPALIIGSGTFGAHLAGQLREHPELGLRLAGFLDSGVPRRDLPEPVLGRPADLARIAGELGIRRVLVCFGETRDEDLVPVLRASGRLAADVCVVPRLHELGLAVPRASLDEIWGVPLIPLRHLGRGLAGRGMKRAFDIMVSAGLLAAAAPLLLVLGAVIRWQTGHSALFRQVRVTGAGRAGHHLEAPHPVRGAGNPQLVRRPGPVHEPGALAAGHPPGRAAAAGQRAARGPVAGRAAPGAGLLRQPASPGRSPGTATGTGCGPASPAGRRSTGCTGTRPSPSAAGSTTPTSSTGRPGWTWSS